MHPYCMVVKKTISPVCRHGINIEYNYIPKSARDIREIICDSPKIKEIENIWQAWELHPQHVGFEEDLTSVVFS